MADLSLHLFHGFRSHFRHPRRIRRGCFGLCLALLLCLGLGFWSCDRSWQIRSSPKKVGFLGDTIPFIKYIYLYLYICKYCTDEYVHIYIYIYTYMVSNMCISIHRKNVTAQFRTHISNAYTFMQP